MDITLIPFAIYTATGELVDVSSVKNGEACGCTCPGCGSTLVARQGPVNNWHFGHKHSASYDSTKRECEYSFFFSVRAMSKQIFSKASSLHILLPEYRCNLVDMLDFEEFELDDESYDEIDSMGFQVTSESEVVISNIRVETKFNDVLVDVVAEIGSFTLVIYFVHPGRFVPEELMSINDPQTGVVCFDLTMIRDLLWSSRGKSTPYLELLESALLTRSEGKSWTYHPRYNSQLKKALVSYEDWKIQKIELLREQYENEQRERKKAQQLAMQAKTARRSSVELTQMNFERIALSGGVYKYKPDGSGKQRPVIQHASGIYSASGLQRYVCRKCNTEFNIILPATPFCPKCLTYQFSVQIGTPD